MMLFCYFNGEIVEGSIEKGENNLNKGKTNSKNTRILTEENCVWTLAIFLVLIIIGGWMQIMTQETKQWSCQWKGNC